MKDSFEVLSENFRLSSDSRARTCIGVEVCDPEIIVIHGRGLVLALLNAKKGVPDSEDMYRCGLLPEGHPEELLVEL